MPSPMTKQILLSASGYPLSCDNLISLTACRCSKSCFAITVPAVFADEIPVGGTGLEIRYYNPLFTNMPLLAGDSVTNGCHPHSHVLTGGHDMFPNNPKGLRAVAILRIGCLQTNYRRLCPTEGHTTVFLYGKD